MKHRMGTDDTHVFVDEAGRICAAYVSDGSHIYQEDVGDSRFVLLVMGGQQFLVRKQEDPK